VASSRITQPGGRQATRQVGYPRSYVLLCSDGDSYQLAGYLSMLCLLKSSYSLECQMIIIDVETECRGTVEVRTG